MKSKNKYSRPFSKEVLTIPVSDPEAHPGEWKDAVDFILDFNVPVLAAANGIIEKVKDNSKEGGLIDKFKDIKKLNYITIKHANDEYSQYAHIAYKGVLVKEGDKVRRGQKIAKGMGMVGYTGGPHLHFVVFNEDNKILEINWKDYRPKIHDSKSLIKELQKPKYKKFVESLDKGLKKCTNYHHQH